MGGVGSVLSNPRKVAPICQEAIHPVRESGRHHDQQDQDQDSLKKSGSVDFKEIRIRRIGRNQEEEQEVIHPT